MRFKDMLPTTSEDGPRNSLMLAARTSCEATVERDPLELFFNDQQQAVQDAQLQELVDFVNDPLFAQFNAVRLQGTSPLQEVPQSVPVLSSRSPYWARTTTQQQRANISATQSDVANPVNTSTGATAMALDEILDFANLPDPDGLFAIDDAEFSTAMDEVCLPDTSAAEESAHFDGNVHELRQEQMPTAYQLPDQQQQPQQSQEQGQQQQQEEQQPEQQQQEQDSQQESSSQPSQQQKQQKQLSRATMSRRRAHSPDEDSDDDDVDYMPVTPPAPRGSTRSKRTKTLKIAQEKEKPHIKAARGSRPDDAESANLLQLPPAEFRQVLKGQKSNLTGKDLEALRKERRKALNRAYQQKSRSRKAAILADVDHALAARKEYAQQVRNLVSSHFKGLEASKIVAFMSDLTRLDAQFTEEH